jgi:RimJ/RimL family protein N-acetyltransferase
MRSQQATATALLGDGTPVALRPVGPDDKPLLEEGMAQLSATSRRFRFMAPVDRLSRAQLAYLTEIDHSGHIAWGALIDGRPVAVGRIVRLEVDPAVAELAITVVDDWQRRGLGSLMVRLMAELGRSVGVQRFTFDALPENQGITCLLAGFGAEQTLVEGVITGTVELDGIRPPQLARGDVGELASAARRRAG